MATTTHRDSHNVKTLGIPLNKIAKEARVLMVGAGGIGCELLKNLVLSGFGEIHIVDLDTIDLSNLNRQFLFRHEHIKKSKALVARDAAHNFNPNVWLQAYHANIKDSKFSVDWFKGFTMVFNALDNLDARRHVNKMCLAADIPLVESGTTGFQGQAQVIKKGVTACYDCTPKQIQKTFPVCTIRSTPSQPIHCIVWGKSYLMNEIFGASEDDSGDMDHSEDTENAQEIEKLRQEAQALKQIRESMGTESFAQKLFDKVFRDDIIRLRSMEEMWKTRRPPEPLDYATIMKSPEIEATKDAVLRADQRAWNLQENTIVFTDSLNRLSKRMAEMKGSANSADGYSTGPMISFDKDDEDTLDFVAASANLRSILFGIDTKSRFDIKQMAGNIIPAIATTNAIVAGLCVLESFKVLRGEYDSVKDVFLSPSSTERLVNGSRASPPKPNCPVCSVAQTRLLVDMSRATLGDLVEDFLRIDLGYGEEFVVNHGDALLYDVEETDNLTKKLSELGIKGDSFLTVIDEDDNNPRVNLVLNVQESASKHDKPIKGVDIDTKAGGDPMSTLIPRRKQPKPAPQSQSNGNGTAGLPSTNGTNGTKGASSLKRSADESLDVPSSKKTKLDSGAAVKSNGSPSVKKPKIAYDGAVIIDDAEDDGVILIE